jgi:hypothetical protein
MQSAFSNLLETALPHIRVIFWDLDGTLGEQPGWSGNENIKSYIAQFLEFKKLLRHLSLNHDIYNVLVSRNGMFCGNEYGSTEKEFKSMGFDEIFSCYRTRAHSKVFGFANLFSVLLIDDQLKECMEAQADGACALHIGDIFQRAVVNGNFAILYP